MPAIGRTNPYARSLRHNATEVEKRLWQSLRNRQLGGYKFRRQATVGRYIADFLCVEARLIVELDGGQHGTEADRRRTADLNDAGYHVLRFWNHEVMENEQGVLQSILDQLVILCAVRDKPSPNPLPRAGEGSSEETAPP
ncbi:MULTISPECIES: endonuclease domain-containing protein [unclassified Sphingomonas]|jgi:very-short-patch-repair endonuclease|uniref:endonuclease domain-containing protein n=1 Tax=unclassified Sphingomonas TaxID=196159 RepID=UPI000835D7B6|nr:MULTISPECIES: endonuclease domain-containing protein [unclassified Sphingomonas]